jgi:hypothetical protein
MITNTENEKLLVSIKLNTTISRSIIAALQRFNYKVTNCFMAEDYNGKNEKEFDSVLKFFDL